jgi:hypothetical protein
MADLESELGLEKLYQELLAIELGDQDDNHNYIKFLVTKTRKLSFRMDGDKRHQRPHVHIGYGREPRAASYAIDDGTRLAGDLNNEYDHAARQWISSHRKRLRKLWKSAQAGRDGSAIVAAIQRTSYD